MQCIRNAHLLERLGCFIRILDEFPLLIEARFLLRQHGQQDVSPRLGLGVLFDELDQITCVFTTMVSGEK